MLSIVPQQYTQYKDFTSRESSSYQFPGTKIFIWETNKQNKQNPTHTPLSPFIHIHYLVTMEQSLEASQICAAHTLRYYLGPWQQRETEILLIFCSPNIISHAVLLTIEEVLKPLSPHNIYTLISEEYVPATKRNGGPQTKFKAEKKEGLVHL